MSSESSIATASQERALQAESAHGPSKVPGGRDLLKRRGQLVDLTRPVYEEMPMWFGHQKTYISVNQDHEEFKKFWGSNIGVYARHLATSEHCDTHTNAIIEYDPDGPALDETPRELYYGSAVSLDLSEVEFCDPDPAGQGYATPEVIKRAEEKLGKAGQEIRAGDIVLGWFDYGDRHFPSREFVTQCSGYSFDGVEYLASRGVVNVGTDNLLNDECSAHMACKAFGLVNTERLTNLGQLVGKRFDFFGLPVSITGGTGSPIRAVAWFSEG